MELPNEDIKFIADETFDFGFPSPSDGLEEEDLVSCPSEHSERGLAKTIDMNTLLRESESKASDRWSPLSPEKQEEVRKEANMLVAQMEKCGLLEKENASSDVSPEKVPGYELFSPIRFLQAENKMPRNSRRRTFNVKNSPLIALLPTVGSETHSARDSPRVQFPKGQSSTPCVAHTAKSNKLQNKTNSCTADSRLFKKAMPSKSPSVSPTVPYSDKKATTISSRKGRPSLLAHPGTTKNQNLPLDFRPALQTKKKGLLRKLEEGSSQACSAQNPELKLQDSITGDTVPVSHGKRKVGPRVYPSQTKPGKKSCSVQGKVPLQKANATPLEQSEAWPNQSGWLHSIKEEKPSGQAKIVGGNVPQPRATSMPHSTTCQTQTRSIPKSALATRLPVPKSIPTSHNHITASGRHVVPGRSSQLKPLTQGLSGGKGSMVSTSAGKKAFIFQQKDLSGTSQSSRTQLPKKAISDSAR